MPGIVIAERVYAIIITHSYILDSIRQKRFSDLGELSDLRRNKLNVRLPRYLHSNVGFYYLPTLFSLALSLFSFWRTRVYTTMKMSRSYYFLQSEVDFLPFFLPPTSTTFLKERYSVLREREREPTYSSQFFKGR